MAYNGFKGIGPRGLGTSPLKQLKSPSNYNVGDLIDETDNDNSIYQSSSSKGKIAGTDYNVENLSEIQEDKQGQYVTSLDDSESYGDGNRPKRKVTNYNQGYKRDRDTLRPVKGKIFKKD
tara:strand:- start:375 stop:734 length:360 start_codon:yes stop_codon:yes gene_type:complete